MLTIATHCLAVIDSNPSLSQQSASNVAAQADTFDVVSIKLSDPKSSGFVIRPEPNSFMVTGISLKVLVEFAYNLHDFQVDDASAWMQSTRFDIVAKMDAPSPELNGSSTPENWNDRQRILEARLRSLLADRFKLRAHKTVKEKPIYGLVVAKGGPKVKEATINNGYTVGRGQLKCSDLSMESLASILSSHLDRIVVDQTKLPGGYAFTLTWNPDDTVTDTTVPGIFTALQEQLGLKLVPSKGPVDILLIDHAEMPSAN